MSDNDSVLASLNELQDMDFSSQKEPEVAKVKKKKRGQVKQQKWSSDDNADNLLAGLLGEAEAEAEAERHRLDAERRRRDDEERLAKEMEEERKRIEGERRLAEERARMDQIEKKRTQMLAAIERERKIEAGEIDVEEEARKKREAEAKKRAEEEAKRQKEQALKDQKQLIEQQNQQIAQLAEKANQQPQIIQQKSSAMPIIALAATVLIVGGGLALYFLVFAPKPPADVPDPYAMEASYTAATIAVAEPESIVADVALDVVSQSSKQTVTQIPAGSNTGTDAAARKKRRGKGKSRSGGSKSSGSKSGGSKGGKNILGGKGGGSKGVLGGGKGGGIVF